MRNVDTTITTESEHHHQQTATLVVLQPKRMRSAVSMREDETDSWGADVLDERDDYVLTMRDPTMMDKLTQRLNTFRKNRELCDVVLFVCGREIHAHKVVLAAMSPALYDMFKLADDEASPSDTTIAAANNGIDTNGSTSTLTAASLNELTPRASASADATPIIPTVVVGNGTASTVAQSYFEFPTGDFDCFDALVNYAYTSMLEIANKKVPELYKTAFSLQIESCTKACARHLAANLSNANCIGIRKSANFNNDVLLASKVDTFIQLNIGDVIASNEFSQLPRIKVRIIVAGSDMRRGDAGPKFAEKALQYFQMLHPNTERIDVFFDQLLEKMHLLYLEDDYSLQDCTELDDRSSVGSSDVVQDYKRIGTQQSRRTSSSTPLVPTLPASQHVNGATAVRINASRVGNNRYSSCESLNSLSSASSENVDEIDFKVIALHRTTDDGYWIALVVLHRRLVSLSIQLSDNDDLVRPRNGADHTQERAALFARLVNANSIRTPLPCMNQARCSVGAAVINDKIIVCGGYDRGECIRTVEQYDVAAAVWSMMPSMRTERGRFDAVFALGKLYAVAGSNGSHDLKSVECYDPQTEMWTSTAPLSFPRSHNACASIDDIVYCIGGCNEQVVLKDCERYLPKLNVWEKISPMRTGRFQAGCTTWKGMLIAAGGCDRWNCLDSIEEYDPRTDVWRQIAVLKTARRGCAVAVVNDSLYVIGGSDGVQSLSSVEIIDLHNGSWRSGPELTTPRANVHSVVCGANNIYTIGGYNGKQFLSTMEVLEFDSIEWRSWQLHQSENWSISEDPLAEEQHQQDV